MPAEGRSLGSRAVGAGVWTVGTRLATKLIDLGLLIGLARLLGPEDFGLVAVAMAVVFIVEALFELPMAAALIRVPALDPRMLHTAFTLGLIRGAAIAAVLAALAWPLAIFNEEPRLGPLLTVLGAAPVLRGLASPRMVEYARAFDFRPDAMVELGGKVAAAAVSLALALTTHSYWAIAAATVTGPLVGTALTYVLAPLRPRLTVSDWPRFSNLVGWNFVSQLCVALNWQIDRLVLPPLLSIASFGQYAMGKQISEIPYQALIAPLHRPAMAMLSADGRGIQARYLQLSRAISLVMIPVVAVPVLWPQPLVHVALGPAWLETARWLPWLSLSLMTGLPAVAMSALAMTLDRTRLLATRTLVELLIKLPLVWLAAAQFGIPGAILGGATASLASMGTALVLVRRLAGIGVLSQLATLRIPLAGLIPAAPILWFTRDYVMAAPGMPLLIVRAVAIGAAFALTYGAGVMLGWRLAGRPAGLEQHLWARLSRLWQHAPQRHASPAAAESGRAPAAGLLPPAEASEAPPRAIVINGKFLMSAGPHSGVYRVAQEILMALDTLLTTDPAVRSAVRCRVLMPGAARPGLHLPSMAIEASGALSGRLKALPWEQAVLPWKARHETLVNLCNLGPVAARDAVTMIHDAQVHSSPASYSLPFRLWYRLVQPLLARRNRAILTVSNYSRQQLDQYGVAAAGRTLVVHNGCDHVLRLVPDASAVAAAGLAGRRYVVALSNTQVHKNIAILLEAFRSPALHEVTLALFGSATRADFERGGHEVPPNVRFLGRISDEALAGLLEQAVALAFPSLTEGFGLPPLEAMALGCAVVAAPCGALPEVCGDAALWADPHDAGQWARQILLLCEDAEAAQALRARGRAHAAAFTWERAARRLLELVLGSPLPNAAAADGATSTRAARAPTAPHVPSMSWRKSG